MPLGMLTKEEMIKEEGNAYIPRHALEEIYKDLDTLKELILNTDVQFEAIKLIGGIKYLLSLGR